MSTTEPPPLEELVFEFLERTEASDRAPSEVLRELCSRWPSRADALRSSVERLAGSGFTASDHDPLEAGERAGRYALGRRLGAGGMGVVYVAWRDDSDRPVALKLLRHDQLTEPGARERFEREIAAAARLDHPNIVHVVEHGTLPSEGGERPFVAFERLAGGTLERVVQANAAAVPDRLTGADLLAALEVDADPLALPSPLRGAWWEVVVRIAREVARALAHAHARGVVHRDVKPSNVLVTPEGRVVLLDFGLASLRGSSRLTATGVQLGSLPYMPPERVRGEGDAGERGDVYSLGVTLYELLTLRLPFTGPDGEQVGLAIAAGAATPPSRVRGELPADVAQAIDAVVGCAMDVDPRRRYASAEALAADLTALLRGRSVTARPPTSLERSARWLRRRPFAGATLGLALLVAVGAPLGYGVLSRNHASAMERSLDATLGHLARLVDTVESNVTNMSLSVVGGDPRLVETRLQSVDRALALLDDAERDGREFLERDDPRARFIVDTMRHSRAKLQRARADALYDLRDFAAAADLYSAQVSVLRELAAKYPEMDSIREDLGGVLAQQARALARIERSADGLPLIREASEILRRIADEDPESVRRQGNFSAALILLARSLGRLDQDAEQALVLDDALQRLEQAVASDEASWRLWARLGEARFTAASSTTNLAHPKARVAALELALEALDEALHGAPMHATTRAIAAEAKSLLAIALVATGRNDEAREAIASSRDLAEGLVRDRPGDATFTKLLADIVDTEAYVETRTGDLGAGLSGMRAALADARERYSGSPDDLRALFELGASETNLAIQLMLADELGRARLDEAEALATAALERGRIVEASREKSSADGLISLSLYCRAVVRAKKDDLSGVALDLEELESRSAGGDPVRLRWCADAHNERLLTLDRRGASGAQLDEARSRTFEYLGRAVDAGYRDKHELETTPALDVLRDDPRFGEIVRRLD